MGVPADPRYHKMRTTLSLGRVEVTSQGRRAFSCTTAIAEAYTAVKKGGERERELVRLRELKRSQERGVEGARWR